MAMLPPTYETCSDLLGFTAGADVLAAAAGRRIQPVLPRLARDGDAFVLETDVP
jgi:hypothetical protein